MKAICTTVAILLPSLCIVLSVACDADGGGVVCTAELVPVLRVRVQCDGAAEAGALSVQYKLASTAVWSSCTVESSGGGPSRCETGGPAVSARCERLTPRGAGGTYVVRAAQGTFSAESPEVVVPDGECHAQTQQVVLELDAVSE